MLLEARIIRILQAKSYEYWFRILQVREDYIADIFSGDMVYYAIMC